MIRPLPTLAGLFLAAACTATPTPPEVARFSEPTLSDAAGAIPDEVSAGDCVGRDITPATVQTVTEKVLIRPAEFAPDGSLVSPAAYRTETRQEIVKEREDVWFQTPCPDEITPEFVSALQRALQVRGYFQGTVTGEVDEATRNAVRAYQRELGLNSPVLSIAAAKRLGLVAYDREEALAASDTPGH